MAVSAFPTDNFIGGEWVTAHDNERLDVVNPATDEVLATVPNGGASEAEAAINGADRALAAWREKPGKDRGRLLGRLARLMARDLEALTRLVTLECGKPLDEARAEVQYAAGFIEWSAGEAARVYGETIPSFDTSKRILVLRQPIGIAAAITPWNFPAAMITRKLGPALAAGCTMVIKPAKQTPLTALALGRLVQEAEFPPGVVNVITGDASDIGRTFLTDPRVRALSFTGSTEVGRKLVEQSAQNITKLGLELGGHAPFLVFEDADVKAAVAGAVAAKFRNAGQTCVCPNRFYVHERVYKDFVAGMKAALKTLAVGNGLEPNIKIGPIIDDDGVAKIERHVADAREQGGKVSLGGQRVRCSGLADRFFAPTVIEDATSQMLLWREETFGPVVPIMRFRDEDDAVAWANDSPYGLAAYAYTRDLARAFRVAERLEYGIVGINDGKPSTPQAPFGGRKTSGLGREGGKYGLEEFLEIKYVSLGLGDQ